MDEAKPTVRHQGVLEKCGKYTGALNLRKCYCTLQDAGFTYRTLGDKVKMLDVTRFQSILPIRDCTFELITQTSLHTFIASSPAERDNWVKAIQELMSTTCIKKSQSSGGQEEFDVNKECSTVAEPIRESSKFANKFPLLWSFSVPGKAGNLTASKKSVKPGSSATDLPDCKNLTEKSTQKSGNGDHRLIYEEVKATSIFYTYDLPDIKNPAEGEAEKPVKSTQKSENEDQRLIYEEVKATSIFYTDELTTPPNDTDIYSYASTDEVRKAFPQNSPFICNEYASVLDNRCSTSLYSEVGGGNEAGQAIGKTSELDCPPEILYSEVRAGDEPCEAGSKQGKPDCLPEILEEQALPSVAENDEVGIYQDIQELDFGSRKERIASNIQSELTRQLHINTRFQEAAEILESRDYDEHLDCDFISRDSQPTNSFESKCNIAETSEEVVSLPNSLDTRSSARQDINSETARRALDADFLHSSQSECSKWQSSAFDEMKKFIEAIGSEEKTEVCVSGDIIKGESAVDDLKQFLHTLQNHVMDSEER